MVILDRSSGWRYTHEHQQQFYPDDLGLNHMAKQELKEVLWGGSRVVIGTGGGGGGGRQQTFFN
jgi:hypothetical protein